MKNIEVQMLLYTLTKIYMEVQRNMLNLFGIILFYKVVWWFNGQNIGLEPRKPRFNPPTYSYIMWNVYIRTYILYMCVNV
jgi:hypothetical protein